MLRHYGPGFWWLRQHQVPEGMGGGSRRRSGALLTPAPRRGTASVEGGSRSLAHQLQQAAASVTEPTLCRAVLCCAGISVLPQRAAGFARLDPGGVFPRQRRRCHASYWHRRRAPTPPPPSHTKGNPVPTAVLRRRDAEEGHTQPVILPTETAAACVVILDTAIAQQAAHSICRALRNTAEELLELPPTRRRHVSVHTSRGLGMQCKEGS